MISLDLEGGEAGAFRFLDALKIAKLAVSLGGVETLATHPKTTVSSEMSAEELERAGVTDGLVRYSTGVEYWRDLLADIQQALAVV
jgi:methionine-gamma-lyase